MGWARGGTRTARLPLGLSAKVCLLAPSRPGKHAIKCVTLNAVVNANDFGTNLAPSCFSLSSVEYAGVTNSIGPQPPTAYGPQPLQLSPAAAAPVVSPIFAGLHRNRWTSRSSTPGIAPTSATPESALPAKSIGHAASTRQTCRNSPKKPFNPTPSAGVPSSAHTSAARPVQSWLLAQDVPQSPGAALAGHGDGCPSGGYDTCGGESSWPARSQCCTARKPLALPL